MENFLTLVKLSVRKYQNDAVLFVNENTHEIYKHWLRCCQEIPSALVAQKIAKFSRHLYI